MAFRQQPRLQTVRQQPLPTVSTDDVQSVASSQRKRTLQDSQEEWVLFSPTAPSVGTETISSERTPRTAGLSRFSEIASLDTAARSDVPEDLISEVQSDFVEDDGELDSLDDGLHAFHELSDFGSPRQRMLRTNETVLPSHDGQGSFGNLLAQENAARQGVAQPPRKQRRRSAVQKTLDALQEADEHDEEEERNMRIEQWRLEQSRALLEEVMRESRRIRRITRNASSRSLASSHFQTKSETNFSETEGAMTPLVMEEPEPVSEASAMPEEVPPENESFWKRLTRRVIRDLIGIDEQLLSVILGESLPEEAPTPTPANQTPPPPPQPVVEEPYWSSLSWQERLLQRLARELGILVHQLSVHPGAFTAYLKTQDPIPYVGATLPHIPATPTEMTNPNTSAFLESPISHSPSVLFTSTFRQTNPANALAPNADPSLWGIEEEPEEDFTDPVTAERLNQEREYWEQELDVGMVFNFLRSRFSSNTAYPEEYPPSTRALDSELSTTPTATTLGLAAATSSILPHNELLRPSGVPTFRPTSHPMPSALTPASAIAAPSRTHARAALIRAHHPLAVRATPPVRRHSGDQLIGSPQSPTQNQAFSSPRRSLARRSNASSCASQSTKRSKLTSSGNYWDFTGEGPAGSISMSGSRDGIST